MSVAADIREVLAARELAWMLAMREVRVRYKHTILGLGWAIALPVSLMLVFTFLFTRVARVETGGVPYPLFVFLGLVPWQLHSNIVSGAARCLSDQRNLVTKVYFAREALPVSVILSSLVDFAVAMLVVGGLMAWYGVAPGPGLAFAPVVLLVQLALGAGLALVVSAANLLYRDTQYILQVGLQVWMFASSVVYPIPRTGGLKWLAWLNPMTPILDAWRACLVGPKFHVAPEFGLASLISVLLLAVGWRWFRRVERVFGELA